METTRESWRRIIRELYVSFQRTDREMNLLREIDNAIIERADRPGAMEKVFTESVLELSRVYGLQATSSVYIYVGSQLVLLADGASSSPQDLPASKVVQQLADHPGSPPAVLGRVDEPDELFGLLQGANTILLQPIYTEPGRLLAVLLFYEMEEKEGSRLTDPEFISTVKSVARQLSIAYRFRWQSERNQLIRVIWELFLNADLGPTRCFHDLALIVPRAFPSFGPLRLTTQPKVQILVVERTPENDPHYLIIRGTTGDEESVTKIDIRDSVCGLLVENSEHDLPFFCDDPGKPQYRERYKNYLGLDDPTRTEFAVRLNFPASSAHLIGVLNIESPDADAFNLHHRDAILELAAQIAPMVTVFEDRIEHNRLMHLSVGSATGKYLDSLAGIFRHGIASPLIALRGDVEAAKKIVDRRLRPALEASSTIKVNAQAPPAVAAMEDLDQIDTVLDNLNQVHRQIKAFASEFAGGISGFGQMGRFNLHELVTETVSLAERSQLVPSDAEINIAVGGADTAYAFCSSLLKQHLFSLLTNAVFSILERSAGGPVRGTVRVDVDREEDPSETQEVDLNRRWIVSVRDDGIGADADTLVKLRAFQPGNHFRPTVPGQGLGLVAVQRYLGSLGGWITLDSVQGAWFEARLYFDEYREDIHGPMSTISESGSNGAQRD